MGWLRDWLSDTPRYKGKNCWQWAEELQRGRVDETRCQEAFLAMGPRAAAALIGSLFAHNRDLNSAHVKQLPAVQILVKMGPVVVPQLVDGFLKGKHSPNHTRELCGIILEVMGPSVISVLAESLGARGEPDRQAEALLLALHSPQSPPPRTLYWALACLEAPAWSLVVETLEHGDAAARVAAAEYLGWACEQRPPLVPATSGTMSHTLRALVAALGDGEAKVRLAARIGVIHLGGQAVPALLEALATGTDTLRREVAGCLASMGVYAAPGAVTALVDAALKDPEYAVRSVAGEALRRFGAAAVSELVSGLENSDAKIREFAATILGGIGDCGEKIGDLSAALVLALRDAAPGVRRAAATALGQTCSCAAVSVPALLAMLTNSDGAVTAAAEAALVRFRATRSEAVPYLAEALHNHEDRSVRAKLATLLAQPGPATEAVMAALQRAAWDEDEGVRRAAVAARGEMERHKQEARERSAAGHRRKQLEKGKIPAPQEYRCSICERQGKPISVSAQTKLILATPAGLAEQIFQCKKCRKLFCGSCCHPGYGPSVMLCPRCQGPLGSVKRQ